MSTNAEKLVDRVRLIAAMPRLAELNRQVQMTGISSNVVYDAAIAEEVLKMFPSKTNTALEHVFRHEGLHNLAGVLRHDRDKTRHGTRRYSTRFEIDPMDSGVSEEMTRDLAIRAIKDYAKRKHVTVESLNVMRAEIEDGKLGLMLFEGSTFWVFYDLRFQQIDISYVSDGR